MKRSRLQAGARSQARGSTFKQRGKILKRRSTPRNALPGPRDDPREVAGREAWWEGWRTAVCVLCGAVGCDPHHIVTEARLRRDARWLGVPEWRLAWDRRKNRLWTCRKCHANHHARHRPITWQELEEHAPKVFAFAAEVGELAWLERMYPRPQERVQ